MKSKKFLISILIVVSLAVGGYAYLGGFQQPEIKQITTTEMYVAGKVYQGSVKNEKFSQVMQEAGKLVETKKLAGDLGGIYYNDPEKHQDSISAFIGVIVADPKMKLPSGFEVRSVPAGRKAIQGNINAHYLLAPNKIFPAIFNYAKDKNIPLQDFFVERYPDTRHAEVIVLQQ